MCLWPRLCIWTWKFLGISADYKKNLNTVLVWTIWLSFHRLSLWGFFPIPWVSAGFVGWAALPVTVMFVSVTLWESHWGSPGLFPPVIKLPPFSSVSHIQEMFPVLWGLCCSPIPVCWAGAGAGTWALSTAGTSHPFPHISCSGLILSPCWVWGNGFIWCVCRSCVCPWGTWCLFLPSVYYFWPIQVISGFGLDEQVWTSHLVQPSQP